MKKYLVAFAAIACLPGVAAAQDQAPDFAGARIEGRIGYETPTVSDDNDVFKVGSAVSFGGEIGYDVNVGSSVVLGPYANYEFSSVEVCDGADCLSEDGNWSVGGRLGLRTGNVLLYGKLGYGQIRFTASSGGVTASDSQGGVQGGLGVNFNLGRHFYGMVEANYSDYGGFAGVNLQRRQVATGIGLRF